VKIVRAWILNLSTAALRRGQYYQNLCPDRDAGEDRTKLKMKTEETNCRMSSGPVFPAKTSAVRRPIRQ
jgi:hypothetical protein